jgi:hypothetical protein
MYKLQNIFAHLQHAIWLPFIQIKNSIRNIFYKQYKHDFIKKYKG